MTPPRTASSLEIQGSRVSQRSERLSALAHSDNQSLTYFRSLSARTWFGAGRGVSHHPRTRARAVTEGIRRTEETDSMHYYGSKAMIKRCDQSSSGGDSYNHGDPSAAGVCRGPSRGGSAIHWTPRASLEL